jgi:hypothetical protein
MSASEQNNNRNVPEGNKNGVKPFIALVFARGSGYFTIRHSTKRKKGFF